MSVDRVRIARDHYDAYVTGDRSVLERALADDFVFYSPPDPGIDRAAYFAHCWPNALAVAAYDFARIIERGDEVIVTYDCRRVDGTRFRNTEVLTFAGAQISRIEVYFGWELAPA